MTNRRIVIDIIAIIAAALALTGGLVCGGPAHAGAIPAAVVAGPNQTEHTCIPREVIYRGMYRIGNDLFAGSAGKLCITSTGDNLTVDTSVPGNGRSVVAAPYIRVGQWYGSGDTTAFPLPAVGRIKVVDHIASNCRGTGSWLDDTDTYLYSHQDGMSGAPQYEVVIANCASHPMSRSPHRFSIGNRTWYASSWITCPAVIPCHRIVVFHAAHAASQLREPISSFIWHSVRMGWIPRRTWTGNTAYQEEIWSGGKGMRLALGVTFPGVPVISPAP